MDVRHDNIKIINELKEDGYLQSIDVHFADFMIDKFGGDDICHLLFALISNSSNEGHSCFYLSSIKEYSFYEKYQEALDTIANLSLSNILGIGALDELKPVLRDKDRFYMHRYFHYEQVVTSQINERVKLSKSVNFKKLQLLLDQYFPTTNTDIDWQRVAAVMASLGFFSVISGGPGTGKTTTVAKILAILIELSDIPLRIKIAAPTGKAAARLQDSIQSAKNRLGCSDDITLAIPDEVFTIHRLLGYIYGKVTFKHNKDNHLDADVVVIDEASMIDIALMTRLLEALRPNTIIIFLGDKDQLASVAPGAVLSDICGSAEINLFSKDMAKSLATVTGYDELLDCSSSVTSLMDCTVQLKKSYRYKEDSDIAKLAPLINDGKGDASFDVFSNAQNNELFLYSLSDVDEQLKILVLNYYAAYLQETDLTYMFEKFDCFRILSGTRKGHLGVIKLNEYIESILKNAGFISSNDMYYHGRPIMVTKNDYSVKLFNGDVGITIYEKESDRMMIYFLQADSSFRKISPARLPAHETVYAMTVHKSQGSEFDHVAFILPDSDKAILSRELIYTAVTRAKRKVHMFAEKNSYIMAVGKKVRRMSGLVFD